MDNTEILIQEYNNIWAEKIIHKQSIRKFHNYLTYITAIGSLILIFHGTDSAQVIQGKLAAEQMSNIINIFFVAFTPIVLITITFPLNDIYHIFALGCQIGELEVRINSESGSQKLLTWEHIICPVMYGGEKIKTGDGEIQIHNIIKLGDYLLLIPAITGICIFSTITSISFLYSRLGCFYSIGYTLIVIYMIAVVALLGMRINSYTKVDNLMKNLVKAKQYR